MRRAGRVVKAAAAAFRMKFVKESLIRATPERVFAFHELPDALARLTPPWEPTRVLKAAADLRAGSRAVVETRLFGLVPVRWVAEHTAYDPPRMFEDVQVKGPFRRWLHRHHVEPHENGSLLRDEVASPAPRAARKDGRAVSHRAAFAPPVRLPPPRHARVVRASGTRVAVTLRMSDSANRNGTHRVRGWLIAGLSLAVLFGVAALKARADSGGELD